MDAGAQLWSRLMDWQIIRFIFSIFCWIKESIRKSIYWCLLKYPHHYLPAFVIQILERLGLYPARMTLYYCVYGNTFRAEIDFLDQLKKALFYDLIIEPTKVEHLLQHHVFIPCILFCVNSTRVGTDAESALQNCSVRPIMVVLNYGQKKASFSNPYSGTHIANDKIEAVHDCYFQHDGLHLCPENMKVVKEVAQHILSRYREPMMFRG